MTQSVSLAAMIPVMLPEDLKDNVFCSSTQMLQIFFLQLRHMDIIMSGDNLYPTLCYHSVTLDLDFNLETNIFGFDWYILIIRDFFLFHVFYSILLFFFCFRGYNGSCVLWGPSNTICRFTSTTIIVIRDH